jgi:N-acetyl-gamma-glutamyl-phosphate reductase
LKTNKTLSKYSPSAERKKPTKVQTIPITILGATGYGGGELLRILANHPTANVTAVTSTSIAGQSIADAHPHLAGFYENIKFTESVNYDELAAADQSVIFSSVPHGAGGATVAKIIADLKERKLTERVRIIDLSGDFRLKDIPTHKKFYPKSEPFENLRPEFVYGLTELNRKAIANATYIANPGCLATASIIAAAPLLKLGNVTHLAIDAKTGSSGSGKDPKPSTHHPSRHSNTQAYKPLIHQHEPEIVQALMNAANTNEPPPITFVPHSLPTVRGIYATVHAWLDRVVTNEEIQAAMRTIYDGCKFIRFRQSPPQLQDVIGSNFTDIYATADGNRVVVIAALDNLVKGMVGAAIQNMNLCTGRDETTGLWTPPWRPV